MRVDFELVLRRPIETAGLIGHWLPRFAIASLEIFKLLAQRIILGRNRAALSFLPVQVFLENGLALLLNL